MMQTTGHCAGMGRRDVMAAAIAIGGAALFGEAAPASAQPAGSELARGAPDTIDVHHHFYAPKYVARHGKDVAAQTRPEVLGWTPEQSLRAMDEAGVRKAIVSVSTPGVWFGDVADASRAARDCNEFAADLARANPRRFGFFAATPLPDPASSLAEISHALDRLGAAGVGLLTSYDGHYLGDARFVPVLQELDRRGAVVYVHPTACDCTRNLVPELKPAFIDYPFDTTRTIFSLLATGSFDRFPRIRFIFSHGGGTVPMLAGRVSAIAKMQRPGTTRFPADPHLVLTRQFYDTASIDSPSAVAALRQFVPSQQILFGTDYPFNDIAESRRAVARFDLSDEELAAVLGGNLKQLIGR